jgi:predicted DNA-binding protein
LAREVIVQQLEDLEDYYAAAKSAKNPGRIYTSGEVERELGL